MARSADRDQYQQQRAEIARAVWRLAAGAGLESVSMSGVAKEAGVSVGRVQYYFRNKDEMLLFGLRLAQERMEERIAERLRRLPESVEAEDVLRAAVGEVIGGDCDTQQVIRVSVAYLPRALEDEQVAEILFGDDAELHELAANVVRAVQAECRASPELDPAQEARIIWSLASDLGSEVSFGQTSVHEAQSTMNYYLDRSLGPGRGS